jgi:hypothetical protein
MPAWPQLLNGRQDVAQVREAVADRLRVVDAMREAVFGRK